MSRFGLTQNDLLLNDVTSDTHWQTKHLLVRRPSLLDRGHLYAVGHLAEG